MEEANEQLSVSKTDDRAARTDLIVFRNDPDCSIAERLSPKNDAINNDPVRFIDVFCIHVEPRACSRVVKELSSSLPLEDCLSHLKRVRRRPLAQSLSPQSPPKPTIRINQKGENQKSTSKAKKDPESSPPAADSKMGNTSERPKKRQKPNFLLEILIGTSSRIELNTHVPVMEHPILKEFGPLHSVTVPKYEPRSEKEWKEHNRCWPTLYHPLKFEEHKRQQLALSESELDDIKELMQRCISTRSVFIVDPKRQTPKKPQADDDCITENKSDNEGINLGIVSISQIEQGLQEELSKKNQKTSLLGNNPLATPILLALQGVSRRERNAKLGADDNINLDVHSKGLESAPIVQEERQQRGQYLCTGYDMYCFYEPNVFEAMACLHSRLRRLVYFVPCPQSRKLDSDSAIGFGISKHDVHNLEGTNHNYRAFEYRQSPYNP